MGEGVLKGGLADPRTGGQLVPSTEAEWVDPLPLFADAGLERDGVLLRMGGVSLDEIARGVGTPAYVYHGAVMRSRYEALSRAFAAWPHRIYYAVKANSNLAVLRLLRDLGAGADIVSAGELRRALAAGFRPETIVFSGVGKTEEELAAACDAPLGCINLESLEELGALETLVARRQLSEPVAIGIRLNPGVLADTHPYISTGQGGIKFGMPADQAVQAAWRIAINPRLDLVSLAVHLGSQLLDPATYVEGLRSLLQLLQEVRTAGVTSVRVLDLGGGLGVRYQDETPLEPEDLARSLAPLLAGVDLEIHLEPGRYLTGTAGVLLTRVLYRKRSGGKQFVIVDAAMNDLMRPSHYSAYHEIVEVRASGRQVAPVDVVGPVCETGDFLALDRPLPDVAAGELLALLGAGAYVFVMSSTYNGRPRPPEVLVDGGRFAVIRPREALEDLYRGETIVERR